MCIRDRRSLSVLRYRADVHARILDPLHCRAIVAVQSALGTDPDQSRTVLIHARDRVVAEAIIAGEVLETEVLSLRYR